MFSGQFPSVLSTGFVLQMRSGGYLYARTNDLFFASRRQGKGKSKKSLTIIYDALRQKGYNPINQIVGYILSEDPTYITTYNNARSLIRRIDRDELLQILVKSYLGE